MVAPPSSADDIPRDQDSLTERYTASVRDRFYAEPYAPAVNAVPMRQRSGFDWSSTSPFPTPALTTSSLSSSSMYGERSPVLTPGTPGGYMMRRTFDNLSMTNLPQARSFDEGLSQSLASSASAVNGEEFFTAEPLSYGHYGENFSSLASSFSGLTMVEQQRKESNRSVEAAHQSIASSMAEPEPTPLLIPMQPTGAGVPLTSVVGTLSSKGSKAAAEDPETVAAAYKLSQWGIGIGPGINPKVASSRNGSQGRGRSTTSEPPIVNTGNSGPMCVQPGDWICTSCGFVNWRRRDLCMRCYPHADGNDVSRGLQGSEVLARRLAAGLDTDTEEYRRSVQALCPDRAKRGLAMSQQRTTMHELPRNPLQAYSAAGGSHSSFNAAPLPQAQGSAAAPSNYLGIHLGNNVQQQQHQQQWRQHLERQSSSADLYASGLSESLPQNPYAWEQPQPSPQQQMQQMQHYQHTNGEGSAVASPYKAYCPQFSWTSSSSTTTAATPPRTAPRTGNYEQQDHQRPELQKRASDYSAQSRLDAAARAGLHRSATHTGADEWPRQAEYQSRDQSQKQAQPQPQPWSPMPSMSTAGLPLTPPQGLTPSGLPRDIWAPAPKRPTLIPVDPEAVSKEKRAKPQPIGTRSAGNTTTTIANNNNTGSERSSTAAAISPGKQNDTLENGGRKDNNNNNNINKNNNVDWISDPITSCSTITPTIPASASAPASGSASALSSGQPLSHSLCSS
ncbi:hypothetical protein NDA16_004254 [Ustilago loliicola]|nr:hypothetical protein NDA16_004254 [Ustilago loliicola]